MVQIRFEELDSINEIYGKCAEVQLFSTERKLVRILEMGITSRQRATVACFARDIVHDEASL